MEELELDFEFKGINMTQFEYDLNRKKDIIIANYIEYNNGLCIKYYQLYKIVIEKIDKRIDISYYHKDNKKWNISTGVGCMQNYIDFSNNILNNINKDNKTKFCNSYDTLIHIELLPELLKSILGKLNDLLYFDKGDKNEQSVNEPIDQLVSN